ncbi:beta-ketoacyl-ACP synthase III [Mesoterricola sediminis]|uniref:Beta-ketoacyl-[acyl-carrier-protein] synthase III n=1 Tax=Mesoterricola sediminis TaxID=2927980 RepID=A0AA48GS55_9BACT|nr:beta-ketoacyl-ACP synthase III [Mesoterricola sediminis]BDU76629.1 3-oxoacyl-ACP synthase III [Mesoterricola sediminis]
MTRRFAIPVGITATGQYYPDRVVTNDELAKMVDTSDEWILTRTGIRTRRWVAPGTGSSDLGVAALRMALDRRGMKPDDLDAIICCTVTPDMFFPCTAALIQHKLGATKCFGFDMNAACSSFLFGMSVGASFLAGGTVRNVAVVGCDVMTSIMDPTDRNTAVLFGDGAGAVILERVEEGYGILDYEHSIDGAGAPFLCMHAGGSLRPASEETVAQRLHYIHQEGKEVYKHAVREMAEVSRLMLDRNNIDPKDLALFVPHQANLRIMDAAAKRLELPAERMACNISEYANTTSATLPTALHQSLEKGKLKKGDLVVFAAFGAGFTWGGNLMRWAV